MDYRVRERERIWGGRWSVVVYKVYTVRTTLPQLSTTFLHPLSCTHQWDENQNDDDDDDGTE